MRQHTKELVEKAHRFSSFYQKDLSNHLPMALSALDGLGATEAQVAAFASRYEDKLEPLPAPAGVINEENAEAFLGRPEALASWIRYFEDALARDGEGATLAAWLDRLMPGVSSIAFHGLVRTAYAVDLGSRAELAHSLAHWAAGYAALGALPPEPVSARTPSEALASLNGDPRHSKRRYAGGRIADRMLRAASDAEFPGIVAAAGVLDLRSLSRALIEAYLATGDFTVLHGVTACDAFAVLTPYLKDEARGRRYLWQALAAAYLSAGGPASGRPLRGNDALSWDELRRLASAATDEHDVKLAYSCWRQFQRYGDDLYRRAASAAFFS